MLLKSTPTEILAAFPRSGSKGEKTSCFPSDASAKRAWEPRVVMRGRQCREEIWRTLESKRGSPGGVAVADQKWRGRPHRLHVFELENQYVPNVAQFGDVFGHTSSPQAGSRYFIILPDFSRLRSRDFVEHFLLASRHAQIIQWSKNRIAHSGIRKKKERS